MSGKAKAFVFIFVCVSVFGLDAQIYRITPDLKVTYGRDARFENTLTTSELFVDQPFYLLVEASATASFMSKFNQAELAAYLFFVNGDLPLIEASIVEANVKYTFLSKENTELYASYLNSGIIRSNILQRFIKQIDGDYNSYYFPISVRDENFKTRLIFRIVPLKTGTQEIRFLFKNSEVPSGLRSQIYRFTILP